MNHYSIEDRVFIVESLYKSDENYTLTLRKWSSEHKNRPEPSFPTVRKLIEKFKRTGSLEYDVEARSSKSRTPDLIESARQIIEEEPTISSRRLSQRLNVSQSTSMKILKDDLQCFPYKIQVAQQLTDAAVLIY